MALQNKMELLLWDAWGLMEEKLTESDMPRLDKLALLTQGSDQAFAELQALYAQEPGLRRPQPSGILIREVVFEQHRIARPHNAGQGCGGGVEVAHDADVAAGKALPSQAGEQWPRAFNADQNDVIAHLRRLGAKLLV